MRVVKVAQAGRMRAALRRVEPAKAATVWRVPIPRPNTVCPALAARAVGAERVSLLRHREAASWELRSLGG